MNDDIVYNITTEGNSVIKKNIENMGEWLISLSDNELQSFQIICEKRISERSEEEDFEVFKYALLLYCREIDVEEISLTEEFIININNTFSTNVIFEVLRRKGIIETSGPILLYNNFEISLTEKGRLMSKK